MGLSSIKDKKITVHSYQNLLAKQGMSAKKAQYDFSIHSNHQTRCSVLSDLSDLLRNNKDDILLENKKDILNASGSAKHVIDRLTLTADRIDDMANALFEIIDLPDYLHKTLESWVRPNGLQIDKVTTAIGCLGIIYEARPNVTIEAAALTIKSGNVAILRPGSSCFITSTFLVSLIHKALIANGVSKDVIVIPESSDRLYADQMLKMNGIIDLIIPRGSKELITHVQKTTSIPILAHREGNCHLYVHQDADIDMAVRVIVNSKMRRVSVCGALESLLIHKDIASNLFPKLIKELVKHDCEIRGCEKSVILNKNLKPSTESDWGKEYLSAILSIKIMDSFEDSVNHINYYGSQHTDGIICKDNNTAKEFEKRVLSSIIVHNASTQFADGGQFGFGGEIGIATGKLPPRGPIGPKELMSYHYHVKGTGNTRP